VDGNGADHRLDQRCSPSLGHEFRLPGGEASSGAFNERLQLCSIAYLGIPLTLR
jgi:hypothetical protein